MVESLKHRGPDDFGFEVVSISPKQVFLGHARLAIIDLSPNAHQPMIDPETGNWITFNGEIYNYRELRRELESKGCVFQSQSDTEVILKCYAVWGLDCIPKLRGIFALGLWDKSRARLVLARDHLGVKPLYFFGREEPFLFASEVRTLLASGLVPRQLDLLGMRSYLAYGSVQDPLTMIKGVRSLPPAHFMIWEDGRIKTQRYWKLPEPKAVVSRSPHVLWEETKSHLEEAVRIQLVSDVTLGAFLSGGIDSTAISALMKGTSPESVRTFSVVFDEKEYDERVYSRAAADHIGTLHTELYLSGDMVRHNLEKALASYDQPSMDGMNTYFVSKVVHEAGLTVALSGVGGDELFGGYGGYKKPLFAEMWGARLRSFSGLLRPILSMAEMILPPSEPLRKAKALVQSDAHPFFLTRMIFSPAQVEHFLKPEFIARSKGWEPEVFSQIEKETHGYDPINRASAMELQTYMLSTLLRDTDQMSMAHALEVRVPFLDPPLVEYLFSVPGSCKLSSSYPKPLLIHSLKNLLPKVCIHRTKQGFDLPFALWLRQGLQPDMEAAFLGKGILSGDPFQGPSLEKLWFQFKSGRLNWSRIWALFVLRNWLARNRILVPTTP